MKKQILKLIVFGVVLMIFSCDSNRPETHSEADAKVAGVAVLQLILIGGPGAGKGTQAKNIQKKYRIPHISTGQILRDEVAKGTELGKQVSGVMQRGGLVSDDIILRLIDNRLRDSDARKGFILDGFPRTLAQAEGLETILQRHGDVRLKVLLLEVSDAEMMKRMMGRGRADDTRETIQNRIQKFHSETSNVIRYYAKKGDLIRVNGEQSIEGVSAAVEKALEKQVSE